MRRRSLVAAGLGLPLLGLAGGVGLGHLRTEREIAAFAARVRAAATPPLRAEALESLPAPVQRYLRFALRDPAPGLAVVEVEQRGDFRRPGQEGFAPTSALQVIAVATPALLFAATTPLLPGIWARAYDFFAEGRMEMRARILSTVTVLDERETAALNRTSLRRWLLESPLYPMGLLPGGPVRWEALDSRRARAVVSGFGLSTALVASFSEEGGLARWDAEEEGDLNTPYHGSGEHAARGDYRLVQGVMVPHRFEIARAAGGRLLPFWRGEVTAIRFTPGG